MRYFAVKTIFAALLVIPIYVRADQYSKVGDGSLYFCYGIQTATDTLDGQIFRSSDNQHKLFISALSDINKRIKKAKAKLVLKKTTKNKKILATLKKTRKDINQCKSNGSTGIADTIHNPDTLIDACAIVGGSSELSASIVYGSECAKGDAPIVLLHLINSDGITYSFCSGTVVSKPSESTSRYVIFAAHCMESAHTVGLDSPSGMIEAESIVADPLWSSSRYFTTPNDVAIAIFPSDLSERSIKVSADDSPLPGEAAIIGGFGRDEDGSYLTNGDNHLKAGTVEIEALNSNSIATQHTGTGAGTCLGDSGGPLLIKRDGIWVLAGVTSTIANEDCIGDNYSFFANIRDSSVRSFLNGVVPGLVP